MGKWEMGKQLLNVFLKSGYKSELKVLCLPQNQIINAVRKKGLNVLHIASNFKFPVLSIPVMEQSLQNRRTRVSLAIFANIHPCEQQKTTQTNKKPHLFYVM